VYAYFAVMRLLERAGVVAPGFFWAFRHLHRQTAWVHMALEMDFYIHY
jgi:hypothetical protein